MALQRSRILLNGLFLLGLLCFGIGCFGRYKAWQAGEALKTWTRATGDVLGVRPLKNWFGSTTGYGTFLRYETPAGPMMRPVTLRTPPGVTPVPVYFDPSSPTSLPVSEARLLAATGPASVIAGYAFLSVGLVLSATAARLRRRLRPNPPPE